MENKDVITGLAALAHDTRLSAFRLLVQAGPQGLSAGHLAERLGVPPQTLSFHLKELDRAGLVNQERDGRSIIYRPNFAHIGSLVGYLTENCCGGACAGPGMASQPVKETLYENPSR